MRFTVWFVLISSISCATNQVRWNQPNATPEVAQKYSYTLYVNENFSVQLRRPVCMDEITLEQSSTACSARVTNRIRIQDNTFYLTAKDDRNESPKSQPFTGSARFYLMEFYWPNLTSALSTPINLRIQRN